MSNHAAASRVGAGQRLTPDKFAGGAAGSADRRRCGLRPFDPGRPNRVRFLNPSRVSGGTADHEGGGPRYLLRYALPL